MSYKLATNDVSSRLELLETENRLLRRKSRLLTGIVGIIVFVAIVVFQAGANFKDVPKIVEAEAFRLLDSDGKLRASLATEKDGALRFILMEATGRARMTVSLLNDGTPSMSFLDRRGKDRFVIGEVDDNPILSLADDDGKYRANLTVTKGGSPSLSFHDSTERIRLSLDLGAQGDPRLLLKQSNGLGGIDMSILPDRTPLLSLNNSIGKLSLSVSLTNGFEPNIILCDINEKARNQSFLGADGAPHILLLDQKDMPVFVAPRQ